MPAVDLHPDETPIVIQRAWPDEVRPILHVGAVMARRFLALVAHSRIARAGQETTTAAVESRARACPGIEGRIAIRAVIRGRVVALPGDAVVLRGCRQRD